MNRFTMPQLGVLEEGANFIEKPFTPNGLTKKVRDVMDKPVMNVKVD